MDKNEQEMLTRAREFDLQALADIYDSYSTSLMGYDLRLSGDRDIAEECVAETFNRFLNALSVGKGPNIYLKAYLYRIAHNWITDCYRRKKDIFIPIEEGLNIPADIQIEEELIARFLQEELRAALFQLTPDQRQVITLVFIEGWKKAEVAAALGKPVGAVKSLQHRGLKALRRILENKKKEEINEQVKPFARTTA
jgi:RNA polymerase sigma-70 factor (ECF subfamily)